MNGVAKKTEGSLFGGLDEAGRGAVIGPLVLALAWFDEEGIEALYHLSVQDSKAFGSSGRARQQRNLLAERIKAIASGWHVVVAQADTVDEAVAADGLNNLERRLACQVLKQAPKDCRIVADGQGIFGPLESIWPSVVAYNKADARYPAVSAASILAKNERDQRILSILEPYQAEFGPITGMGYPNGGTEKFLRRFHEARGCLPPHVRRTWNWPLVRELSGRQGRLPL